MRGFVFRVSVTARGGDLQRIVQHSCAPEAFAVSQSTLLAGGIDLKARLHLHSGLIFPLHVGIPHVSSGLLWMHNCFFFTSISPHVLLEALRTHQWQLEAEVLEIDCMLG